MELPSPARMSLTKLSQAMNNLPGPSPRKVWSKQIQESHKKKITVRLSVSLLRKKVPLRMQGRDSNSILFKINHSLFCCKQGFLSRRVYETISCLVFKNPSKTATYVVVCVCLAIFISYFNLEQRFYQTFNRLLAFKVQKSTFEKKLLLFQQKQVADM